MSADRSITASSRSTSTDSPDTRDGDERAPPQPTLGRVRLGGPAAAVGVAGVPDLRDHRGASAIPLLVFTGTATLDEIGAVLQIDRPRMERLWDELPLADLDIAAMLQTTGPRVVGLRRAARERLDRFLRRRGGQRG